MVKSGSVVIRGLSGLRCIGIACCMTLLLGIASSCRSAIPTLDREEAGNTVRVATTTSLEDSGLLEVLISEFEQEHDATVDLIAVGTGQAMVLGERGDVDLILVHAPALETEFIEQGFGLRRIPIMSNPFVIVGPDDDPADITNAIDSAGALRRIAEAESPFVSRGDDSGTHYREMQIWSASGIDPDAEMDWYSAVGQGMGETLLTANELLAYTLTDRATFITIDPARVGDLEILSGEPGESDSRDDLLDNVYSAIAVNPEIHDQIEAELAETFIEWLTSDQSRGMISRFGQEEFGEPLFTVLD